MWLYSSPLEALVVVVITGTDRTVVSYININSLLEERPLVEHMCRWRRLPDILARSFVSERVCAAIPYLSAWWQHYVVAATI